MDSPDKKRAHSTDSESAANPPAKRHQPMTHQAAMSSAQSVGQQLAAVSGHPTATADAPAAPSIEPAVAASLMTAGLTGSASSAASRLSPGQRCPSDPLSMILSFLDTCDFAAASLVCRHWHKAAELQSAWPKFSVERLIDGLIEDERHWIQSRLVFVNGDRLSAGVLERMAQSPKWRRMVELHLYGHTRLRADASAPLSKVVQLPHLQSLWLENNLLDDAAATFSSLAPRLQAFRCYYWKRDSKLKAVHPYLHLLVNWHVLVLGDRDRIDGQALLPLHQLEYLHLGCEMHRDLLLAIRRLSVQHRLRHLSLAPTNSRTLDLTPLVAELDGADSGLAPAALITIRLRCNLSAATASALLSLPSLTRLDWAGDIADAAPHVDPQELLPSSPLEQLHLDFGHDDGAAAQLLQQAAVRAPQLRQMHIRRPPPSLDQLIRPLRNLRLLDITLSSCSLLQLALLHSLASLPLFSELVLECWSEPFQFIENMLRCIAQSHSWRRIRLIDRFNPSQITLPTDVDARLAERLSDLRVRIDVQEPANATVYRLVVGAEGAVTWQQVAM